MSYRQINESMYKLLAAIGVERPGDTIDVRMEIPLTDPPTITVEYLVRPHNLDQLTKLFESGELKVGDVVTVTHTIVGRDDA